MSAARSRSRGRGGRGDDARRRRRPADDRFADHDDLDEPEKGERSTARRRGAGSPKGGRRGFLGFGSSKGPEKRRGRREGFDWSAAEDDEFEAGPRYADRDTEYEAEQGEEYEEPITRRRSKRRAPEPKRLTLMDLCTPVFGYAAVLPRDAPAAVPAYAQYRKEVLAAIQRIENEAPDNGIELEDARQAAYALCFFLDSQVAGSEWTAKNEWAAEPLGIVLQQDAEGGVNFFKRLESLGDRQRAVKEVFLVCLALGYRGKYAELDATRQAAKIGEIRQKLVRSIHPVPMEKQPELFPEGYLPAEPVEDQIPPPPRWWIWASLGTVAVAAVVWILLFFSAGRTSDTNEKDIRELLGTDAASISMGRLHEAGPAERGHEGAIG